MNNLEDLVEQYEKIMNTLTPLIVADKLKQIKAEFDLLTLKQ